MSDQEIDRKESYSLDEFKTFGTAILKDMFTSEKYASMLVEENTILITKGLNIPINVWFSAEQECLRYSTLFYISNDVQDIELFDYVNYLNEEAIETYYIERQRGKSHIIHSKYSMHLVDSITVLQIYVCAEYFAKSAELALKNGVDNGGIIGSFAGEIIDFPRR